MDEHTAWQAAREQGTPDSFERYLAHYPDGPHTAEARERAASLLRALVLQWPRNANLRKRYLRLRPIEFQKLDRRRAHRFLLAGTLMLYLVALPVATAVLPVAGFLTIETVRRAVAGPGPKEDAESQAMRAKGAALGQELRGTLGLVWVIIALVVMVVVGGVLFLLLGGFGSWVVLVPLGLFRMGRSLLTRWRRFACGSPPLSVFEKYRETVAAIDREAWYSSAVINPLAVSLAFSGVLAVPLLIAFPRPPHGTGWEEAVPFMVVWIATSGAVGGLLAGMGFGILRGRRRAAGAQDYADLGPLPALAYLTTPEKAQQAHST